VLLFSGGTSVKKLFPAETLVSSFPMVFVSGPDPDRRRLQAKSGEADRRRPAKGFQENPGHLKPYAPQTPAQDNRLWHLSWKPRLDEADNLWKDTQDELLHEFLTTNSNGKGEKHSCLYHVDSLNKTGIAALEECDELIKPAAYHPVFFTNKEYLSFGQLSDIHLDVRQYILESSNAQLMPGPEDKNGSALIGKMLTNTTRVFAKALQTFGEDAETDLLFLTGDLVNQTSNVDPVHYRETVNNPAAIYSIWDGVQVGGDFKDNKHHQWNIDSRIAMSLLLHYYRQYQKPVFSLIGNHEDFQLPYGISPRPGRINADPMMCADHNLTYAEAMLMFGESYDEAVIWEEGKSGNMDPGRRFFFHLFFNSLSDFMIKTRKQTFLCLDWEQGQDIIDPDGGEHLTRADAALSDRQLDMIELCAKSDRQNILLSHFAYLSLKEEVPLSYPHASHEDSPWWLDSPSHYFAHGSFNRNIKGAYDKLFNNTVNNRVFDYILSGHTHRAAVYTVTSNRNGEVTYLAERLVENGRSFIQSNRPAILITGSDGPIAKQNLQGEFKGWGHEPPNGLWVKYDLSGTSSYGVRYFTSDISKRNTCPRFAVALDYLAYEDKDEEDPLPDQREELQRKKIQGVFLKFDCQKPKDVTERHIFRIQLNERLVTKTVTRNSGDRIPILK
jgi:hypothetical protein